MGKKKEGEGIRKRTHKLYREHDAKCNTMQQKITQKKIKQREEKANTTNVKKCEK